MQKISLQMVSFSKSKCIAKFFNIFDPAKFVKIANVFANRKPLMDYLWKHQVATKLRWSGLVLFYKFIFYTFVFYTFFFIIQSLYVHFLYSSLFIHSFFIRSFLYGSFFIRFVFYNSKFLISKNLATLFLSKLS